LKPIILEFNSNSHDSLYIQLYKSIRDDILSGQLIEGEKLPSLRLLSKNLNISITTAQLAYNQLLVEGYILSKPQSGYYIAKVLSPKQKPALFSSQEDIAKEEIVSENPYICDTECFDFIKWKKCNARVFNDYSHLLLFGSDPQGEPFRVNFT